ncbi:MAG: hypothetical protein GX594_16765 [Pirellulaceae bacterium]|nr:hypothetical protein [Pirellulaceae bacterium]
MDDEIRRPAYAGHPDSISIPLFIIRGRVESVFFSVAHNDSPYNTTKAVIVQLPPVSGIIFKNLVSLRLLERADIIRISHYGHGKE